MTREPNQHGPKCSGCGEFFTMDEVQAGGHTCRVPSSVFPPLLIALAQAHCFGDGWEVTADGFGFVLFDDPLHARQVLAALAAPRGAGVGGESLTQRRPTPRQVLETFANYDTALLASALDQWDRAFGASYSETDRGQIIAASIAIGMLRERLAQAVAGAGVTEAMVDAAIRVDLDTWPSPPVSDEALQRGRDFYRAVLTAALGAGGAEGVRGAEQQNRGA